MPGRYYEQWTLGDSIRHQPHRTVTETDNLLISALTHNPAPLHLDAEYMKETEYGRILVNSCFTLGLMVGISVNDTTQGTAVANLGWDEVRFPAPIFVGDTLRIETEVLEVRELDGYETWKRVANGSVAPGENTVKSLILQPTPLTAEDLDVVINAGWYAGKEDICAGVTDGDPGFEDCQ